MLMKVMLTLITVLYPVVVFYGLAEFSVRWVSLALLVIFLLRLFLLNKNKSNNNLSQQMLSPLASKFISTAILGLLFVSLLFEFDMGLLFYPVIINVTLALVFLYSLINPPPVIERLARLTQADLPEHAITYTRKVTQVWLAFFIFNALVAAYTALFTNLEIWTLYNGLIAYVLIGVLFAGEYLVRLRVQKRHDS